MKQKKRKKVYRAMVVEVSTCAVVAALANENEAPTLFYMPQEEAKQKNIRLGAVVEVEGGKIGRVIETPRGGGC